MNSNGFYCFPVNISINAAPGRLLVLFAGIGRTTQDDCGSALSEALTAGLPPDYVVILVPAGRGKDLSAITPGAALDGALHRSSGVHAILLVEYGQSGRFTALYKLHKGRTISLKDLDALRPAIVAFGLNALLGESDQNPRLLIKAPAGHLFTKPSQRASNYFIRAENVATHTEEVTFLAFCLLDWVAKSRERHKGELRQIFVDSMSIAVIALTLVELLRQLGACEELPRVESFGSYEGLKSPMFYAPLKGTYLVLISATTSGGLCAQWITRCNGDPEDVATLFSLPGVRYIDQVLCVVNAPKDLVTVAGADEIRGYREINVVGEHFLQQPAKTKAVEIGLIHRTAIADSEFYELQTTDVFSCYRYDMALLRQRALYVDGRALVKTICFRHWLEHAISAVAPASTTAIVYQDDFGSKEMARMAAELLASYGVFNIGLLSLTQLRQRTARSIKGNVLVVAAVISRGSLLLEVSQILRDVQANGGRTYIAGIQLCPCTEDAERLKSNLIKSANSHPYSFTVFRRMFVGNVNQTSSWEQEVQLLRPGILRAAPPAAAKRLNRLERSTAGMGDDCFWRSTVDGAPLTLRPGFVFWPFEYEIATQAGVFVTIASVLERARGGSDLDESKRLASTMFQPVVIDPSTFSRFNDGVIQAAILRAAYPSELDYSGSDELSSAIFVIIKDLLQRSATLAGEAASEFVIALLTGRLRLTRKQTDDMRGLAKALLEQVTDPSLRYLLRRYPKR